MQPTMLAPSVLDHRRAPYRGRRSGPTRADSLSASLSSTDTRRCRRLRGTFAANEYLAAKRRREPLGCRFLALNLLHGVPDITPQAREAAEASMMSP
jgi:hypothetical protein